MERGWFRLILGVVGVLIVAVVVVSFVRSRASRGPAGLRVSKDSDPTAVAATPAGAESPEAWAAGPFTALAGRDLRADLDHHLMLELQTELAPEAEEALRTQLAAFLRAYSGTDFARYLDFRPPETMCALSDPRLQPALAAWSAQLGPVPTDTAGFVASAWKLYVSEGLGPVRPGPIIDAVQWRRCRATIRRLSKREFVAAEWDELAPGESHLNKEAKAETPAEGPDMILRPAVPNALSVGAIVAREGAVLFADFDLVCRARGAAPRRLVLRFTWDSASRRWLPLHALVYGGTTDKPFIW